MRKKKRGIPYEVNFVESHSGRRHQSWHCDFSVGVYCVVQNISSPADGPVHKLSEFMRYDNEKKKKLDGQQHFRIKPSDYSYAIHLKIILHTKRSFDKLHDRIICAQCSINHRSVSLNLRCCSQKTNLTFLFFPSPFFIQSEYKCCTACDDPISDRYILEVSGHAWHGSCLRCCVCLATFDQQTTCFVRDDQIYCKEDYLKWVYRVPQTLHQSSTERLNSTIQLTLFAFTSNVLPLK